MWIRDHFWMSELNQPAVVFNEFIGFQGWKALRVKQQILFHFIPHDVRKYESAESGRAE
jgi:hypothetical protein